MQIKNNGNEEKKWVWIPHPETVYTNAMVIAEQGDTVIVQTTDGVEKKIPASQVQKMNPPRFDRKEDMALLSHLNEPAVLHNLRQRFFANMIYTYSGLFLIAMNPYCEVNLYTTAQVKKYAEKRKDELPPHIFAIANEAYSNMISSQKDQSILITGESGAGKTVNTKKVIQFLTTICSSNSNVDNTIEQQILVANPVLEAFGNAQTIKNDNSSRFGKFIKIEFHGNKITGAYIDKYLLEKSRVTIQNPNERNYHIFYQLITGGSPELLSRLKLIPDLNAYAYTKNTNHIVPGISDKKEFENLLACMNTLEFTSEEKESIFSLVAVVLHLGNIKFVEKNDQAEIVDMTPVENACGLLGISALDFAECVLHPLSKAGNEVVLNRRSKAQACSVIEALARLIYERLFDWIFDLVNRCLHKVKSHGPSIGVLDIAGFEIFKTNGFEQLCINYTNEKLQQFFNQHMFILEQEIYKREGLDWEYIDFGLDLQPTIDLIEKNNPIGIFSFLDEECVMPRGSDETFLHKLEQNIKSPKFKAQSRDSGFELMHYAGKVEYKVQGWLQRNRDSSFENLDNLLKASNVGFIFEKKMHINVKKGYFRTVAQIYKEQLANLMRQLGKTEPHFVRCIVPNLKKRPGLVDNKLVMDQLRCNGVLEGIRISRQGYPTRMLHHDFVRRYKIVADYDFNIDDSYSSDLDIKRLIDSIGITEYKLGRTMIFLRQGVLADLEDLRSAKVASLAREIQSFVRRRIAMRRFGSILRNSILLLQRNARSYIAFRKWAWWRLYLNIKPLLEVTKFDEEIKKKEEIENNLKGKIDDLEVKNKKLLSVIEELKGDIENLKDEKSNLGVGLEAERRRVMEKEEMLDALRGMNKELEIKKAELENKKTELESDKMDMQNKNKKLDEALKMLRSKENELNIANEKLNDQLSSMKNQIAIMKDQLLLNESDKNDKNAYERELKLVKVEMEELTKNHEFVVAGLEKKLKSKVDDFEREKRELIENHKGAEARLRSELEAVKGEVEKTLELERDKLLELKKNMQNEIDDIGLENTRLKTENRNLVSKVESAEVEVEKIRAVLNSERSNHAKVVASLREEKGRNPLEKKLKALEKELAMEKEACERLAVEKSELHKENMTLAQEKLDDMFKHEAEIEELKRKLREVEEDEGSDSDDRVRMVVESERRGREELKRQLMEQEQRNLALTNELMNAKKGSENSEIKAKVESLKKLIKRCVEQTNTLFKGYSENFTQILMERRGECAKLTDILKVKEEECRRAQDMARRIRRELDLKENAYNRAIESNDELKKKLYDEMDRVEETEKIIAHLKEESNRLKEVNSGLERRIENLKKGFLLKNKDDSLSLIEELKKENESLREELINLSSDKNRILLRINQLERDVEEEKRVADMLRSFGEIRSKKI
ncbi:putative myosin heavy chain [Astathelohania contejeani]|uniref:Myosin heavy chain n=1 Tax=Astathelohania contejeani TaxID=164912 RepID=A0ABQ7HXG9_9MICR|nr:putative myosin heavy chain [Thelohania contejeani]